MNEWERASHSMSDHRKGGRRYNRWSPAFLSLPIVPLILPQVSSNDWVGRRDNPVFTPWPFTFLFHHGSLMRTDWIPPGFLFDPQWFESYARPVFFTVTV